MDRWIRKLNIEVAIKRNKTWEWKCIDDESHMKSDKYGLKSIIQG